MAGNEYHFVTHWRVQSTVEEVTDVIRDAEELPRWWPSVYLDVEVLEPGDRYGVGTVVDLYTKGWLPALHTALAVPHDRNPSPARAYAGGLG